MDNRQYTKDEIGIPQPGDIIFFRPPPKRASLPDAFIQSAQKIRGGRQNSEFVHAAIVTRGNGDNCSVSHFISSGYKNEPLGVSAYQGHLYMIIRPNDPAVREAIIAEAEHEPAAAKYSTSKVLSAYVGTRRRSFDNNNPDAVKEICSSYVQAIIGRVLGDKFNENRNALPQDLLGMLERNPAFTKVYMSQDVEFGSKYQLTNEDFMKKLEKIKATYQKQGLFKKGCDVGPISNAINKIGWTMQKPPYENLATVVRIIKQADPEASEKSGILKDVIASAIKLKILTKENVSNLLEQSVAPEVKAPQPNNDM